MIYLFEKSESNPATHAVEVKVLRFLFLVGLVMVMVAGCASLGGLFGAGPQRGERFYGVASWYGAEFQGRRTASGEGFDMNDHTAAHRTLPFGTLVRVTNLRNGLHTTVRINDRGPWIRGRDIDLSYRAARELRMINSGVEDVLIEVLSTR